MIRIVKSIPIKVARDSAQAVGLWWQLSRGRVKCFSMSSLALLFAASPVYGERPLYVEGLISEAGEWKLDMSIAYANRDGQGLHAGEPLLIQTGPTSFLPVYLGFGEETTNSDTIATTLGLRYGITTRTEIYGRVSGYWSETRAEANSSESRSSSGGVSDGWLGVSHMFKEDDDLPGLIAFGEVALLERENDTSSHLKSGAIGLTAYKAIDPIVLSMNVAYRFGREREAGGILRTPGSLFVTSGSVAFAANDRISLSAGAQWTSAQPDAIDGEKAGIRRNSTDLLLGVGYGFSYKNLVNVSLKSNVSGGKGADLNLAWSYTF